MNTRASFTHTKNMWDMKTHVSNPYRIAYNGETDRYEVIVEHQFLLNSGVSELAEMYVAIGEEVTRQKKIYEDEQQKELAKFVDTYASEENIKINLDNPFYAQDLWDGEVIPGIINTEGAIVVDEKEAKRIVNAAAERERLNKIGIQGIYARSDDGNWNWEYWFYAHNGETGELHNIPCDKNGVALDPQWREKV